jgi:hypothetical protein
MRKPVSALERYLAGEFADEPDFLNLRERDREAEADQVGDSCPLKRFLAPFARKGS